MTAWVHAFIRWLVDTRTLHYAMAWASTATGSAYVLFPPNTTIGFFSAAWPPILWGLTLLAGGIVKVIGLHTRILDWQLLGLTLITAGVLSLTSAQTMVMLGPPITPTRAGGVLALWMLFVLVLGRLAFVACDRQDGKQAQEQTDEGR